MSNNESSNYPALRIASGSLTLGREPEERDYPLLQAAGITRIITVATKTEQAENVKQRSQSAGFEWHWMPMVNTLESSDTELEHCRQYIQELTTLLSEGASIYLQDDDSLLRATLLTLAVLHQRGVPAASAYPMINDLTRGFVREIKKAELQWAGALGDSIH